MNVGKINFGKVNAGKINFGKVNAGKINFGKVNAGKINFGKIVHVSTVDWYRRSVCTIFFNGCPFRCIWCQNYELIDGMKWADIEDIKKDIVDTETFISAVVFSGGEPTMQPNGLIRLAEFIKSRGLLVGIQTNGYYPGVLKKLAERRLVDKIFLDIKADPLNPEKYNEIVGNNSVDVVRRVVQSLHVSDVDIEIRTTIFRYLNDSLEIARYLEEHNYNGGYIIQQGIPWNTPDNKIRKEDILSRNEMIVIAKNVNKMLKADKGIGTNVNIRVKIKTRERGEEYIKSTTAP